MPLARLSVSEIARVAVVRDIVEAISVTTVWRWLSDDALKPWHYRSWIFPRDPAFERKAGLILDLYRGIWQGEPLRPDEHVVCADEKTSIQARARIHDGSPPAPGRARRVEHEYERRGALAYRRPVDTGSATRRTSASEQPRPEPRAIARSCHRDGVPRELSDLHHGPVGCPRRPPALRATRIARLSGHGFLSIVLYLVAIGIGALGVGVLLTRTLVGDATISLC